MLLRLDDKRLMMNNVYVGDVYKEVDGYYVFEPARNTKFFSGSWKSHNLREIADFLDNLNAEWDAEVQEFFGG